MSKNSECLDQPWYFARDLQRNATAIFFVVAWCLQSLIRDHTLLLGITIGLFLLIGGLMLRHIFWRSTVLGEQDGHVRTLRLRLYDDTLILTAGDGVLWFALIYSLLLVCGGVNEFLYWFCFVLVWIYLSFLATLLLFSLGQFIKTMDGTVAQVVLVFVVIPSYVFAHTLIGRARFHYGANDPKAALVCTGEFSMLRDAIVTSKSSRGVDAVVRVTLHPVSEENEIGEKYVVADNYRCFVTEIYHPTRGREEVEDEDGAILESTDHNSVTVKGTNEKYDVALKD